MSLQLLVTFLLTITVSPVASCSVLFTCLAALAARLNMGLLKQCLTVFGICQACAYHFCIHWLAYQGCTAPSLRLCHQRAQLLCISAAVDTLPAVTTKVWSYIIA